MISLLIASRFGLEITLYYPKGFEMDKEIIKGCKENAKKSGGEFHLLNQFSENNDFEIIYARHWAHDSQQKIYDLNSKKYKNWFLTKKVVKNSFFIHPMPITKDEVADDISNSENSLLKELITNKYYLQKTILAL